MKSIRLVIFAFAIALLVAPAWATTYIVAKTGSDSNNGTSTATPFLTINKAYSVLTPGDRIQIRSGTYTERVMANKLCTSIAPCTIERYPADAAGSAIIRGNDIYPSLYFYRDECDENEIGESNGNIDCADYNTTVRNLTIYGSATGTGDGNAVKVDGAGVTLIGNRICCAVADVVKIVRTANRTKLINNEIWQNSAITTPAANAQGVDIVGADDILVRGNWVHDVPDVGMYAKGNARRPIFENNLLTNIGGINNGHAIMMGQSTDEDRLKDGNYETYDAIVRNNVVIGATWACLASSSSYNAMFAFNSCYDTGKLSHGSVLLSNESTIGQVATGVTFRGNIFDVNKARPVFKIYPNAFSAWGGLVIADNIYWTTDGTAPTFQHNSEISPSDFASWLTNFATLTGNTDNSVVADPKFRSVTPGWNALYPAGNSPAIDTGPTITGFTKDFAGRTRSTPDKGAWEFFGTKR